MKRKLLAFLLMGAMSASLLVGCGGNEEGGAEESSSAGEEAGAEDAAEEGDDAAAADAEEEDEDDDEEGAELKVALLILSPMDTDQTDHVEEALNAMLEEKLDATADFMWMDAPTYMQQVPMMLQASEQLDLMMFTPIPVAGFQSFMSQNQLLDITDLVDKYAPDVKDVMGDYLEATTKEGRLYGVGNMTCLQAFGAMDIRADLAEKAGVAEKAKKASSWADVKEVLEAIAATGEVTAPVINSDAEGTAISPQPYVVGNGDFSDAEWLDVCGDSYQYTYADPADDKIKCYFENQKWIDSMKLAREFYEDGLIHKDASTAQDYGNTLIKNGVGAAMSHAVELGNESAVEAATGYPDIEIDIAPAKAATSIFQKFGFAVPVTAEYPKTAIKLMNLIWTDPEFRDTLTWGVEGTDWVKNDDGTATYPDGVTAETVQYHTADFLYGNRLEITPWEGEGADIRDRMKEANEAVESSKYLGFAVDSTNVSEKIAAVKNVVDKYKPGLAAGVYEDVEGTVQKFIDEMYGAGLQDILDEYQSQLDVWLAAQ